MPLPIYQSDQKPMDYLNEVIQSRPDREQQYQGALSQMKDAYAKRSVEGDDAAQWAALAKGFAKPAENFWQSLANAGGAKGDVVAGIEARDLGLQREAAMQHYKAATDLLKNDDMLARALATRTMMGGAKGEAGVITRQQPDGTVIVLDKVTGAEIRRYDPIESKQYVTLLQKFIDQAKDIDTVDPEYRISWAQQQAMAALEASRGAVGNRSPAPGSPNAAVTPPRAPVGQPMPPPMQPAEAPLDTQGTAGNVSVDFRNMTTPQLVEMYGRVPEAERPQFLAALRNARQSPAQAPGQPQAGGPYPAPAGAPPLKNAETEEERKARGAARGKEEYNSYIDMQKTGSAARTLEGNLNVLEQLYTKHGDNIPSGAFGPAIGSIKSALGSLGLQLSGNSVTDVINSISTIGALQSKRVDGENLLPGAMVTYEERMLQNAFPGLSMSKEGRLLQIQVMKAMVRTRSELADEARKWYGEHKSFGPQWDAYADRIVQRNPFYHPDRIEAMEVRAKRLAEKGGRP